MKRILLFISLLMPLVGTFSNSYAQEGSQTTLPPILDTPHKKIGYISFLKRTVPELFVRKKDWYVDPLVVVNKEQEFLEWVRKSDLAKYYEKNKTDYVIIDAQLLQMVPAKETQLSLDGIKSLIFEFRKMRNFDPANLASEMKRSFEQMGGQTSNGLLTGMIQSLPRELKATAFKLPTEEKIEFLKTNLTDAMLKTSFRNSAYQNENLTVRVLLLEYNKMLALERELGIMTLYGKWKLQKGGLSLLKQLPSETHKEDEILKRVTTDKRFIDIALREAQNLLKPNLVSREVVSWQTTEKFQIQEVPPNIGLFRGCLNGDCFTTYAYGFAYSPSEKTFLIRVDGKVVTTVYATEVEFAGVKSLYVHEIGQAQLSPKLGPLVLRALFESRQLLGYQKIVIGKKGMHHSQFKSEIDASAEPSDFQDIKFIDAIERESIGDVLVKITKNSYSKSHDVPSAHQKGREYRPLDRSNKVQTNVESKSYPRFQDHPLSAPEIRDLVLDFLSLGQSDLAKLAYQSLPEANPSRIDELILALTNNTKATVLEFREKVRIAMEAAKLSFSNEVFSSTLVSVGHLKSKDAWKGDNSETDTVTAAFLTPLIKANPSDAIVAEFLKSHPAVIKAPFFEKIFRGFLKDNAQSYQKANQMFSYISNSEIEPSNQLVDALLETFNYQTLGFSAMAQNIIVRKKGSFSKESLEKLAKIITSGVSQQNEVYLLALLNKRHDLVEGPTLSAIMSISNNADKLGSFAKEFMAQNPMKKCDF